MKLLDNPKIGIARRTFQELHHSHNFFDVTAEMGLKPDTLY
jgi:hypothetical protein